MTNGAKLVADFQTLIGDADALAKATAAQTGEKIADLRDRVQKSAADLKPRIAQAEALVRQKAAATASAADQYVHARPWPVIGVAAGIGLLLGVLIGRR
jgi:ElaB/YqjD/DUF883 family membrane-anchored ribosome-binding protein